MPDINVAELPMRAAWPATFDESPPNLVASHRGLEMGELFVARRHKNRAWRCSGHGFPGVAGGYGLPPRHWVWRSGVDICPRANAPAPGVLAWVRVFSANRPGSHE